MESWPSSPALIALLERVAPRGPDVTQRRVVGFPATFVNGNLCCGTFNDHFMLRVSDADRAALEARGGRSFEPMPGRPMRSLLEIGAHTFHDEATLRGWFARAAEFTRTLPPRK
jgi:TfoX/Sxy family transcriptional regulator of competence genes